MKYIIREAKPDDINDIIELFDMLTLSMLEMQQQYMNISAEEIGYINERKVNEKYFESVITNERNGIFVAESDDKLVGFIQTCINEKDSEFHIEQYCYIPYYYVKKEYRNFSLDYDLYKEAEDWARKKRLRYLCSDVDGGNEISFMMQKKFCGMKPFKIRLMKEIKIEVV